MVISIKKRELSKRHEDLFDFARVYLSEAFPNPERAGCPQDPVLRAFARNPRQGDTSIVDHVTCCSPCFNAYTAYLDRARDEAKQHRATRAGWIRWSLVSASLGLVLLIVVYALLVKPRHEPGITHNIPVPITQPATSAEVRHVLLDLATAVPGRGRQPQLQTPIPRIPAEPRIDLTLRLPIGSEVGMYAVRVTSQSLVEWSSAGRARIEDGEPVLNMRVDFSHIPDGNYELVVASKGQRLRVPVVIARPPDEQR